jgi:membrane fusion protein
MRPEEMLLPGSALAANGEGVYRIRVKLDQQSVQAYGEGKPLRSGMAVDARVVLDERTIAEWALEPLFSIKGRL